MEQLNLKPGDIILTWGGRLTSRFIRFLQKALLGVKFPPSHTLMIIDNDNNVISADADIVRIKPVEEALKNQLKYVVIREKRIKYDEEDLKKEADKLVGKKYDYFLYFYWMFTIIFALLPFTKLFLFPLESWLKKKKKSAYMCSETVAIIRYNLKKKDFGIQPIEYTTPFDIYQVALACDNFEIVYDWEKEIKWYDKVLDWFVYFIWGVITFVFYFGLFWLLKIIF